MKATAPKNQEFYVVLYDYALELKSQVRPNFTVQPEWREEFLPRLAKGVRHRP